MLLKAAICEDDPTQMKNVKRMVEGWGGARSLKLLIYSYANCEAFLTDWLEKMDFDLAILDIDLGQGINGMELARHIRQKDDAITIVFISGLAGYMSQGYDVRACHFLVKPVKEERVWEVLDKALAEVGKKESYLLLEEETEAEKIPVSRILYAEAFSHTTALYLTPGSGEKKPVCREIRMCLGDLEGRLAGSGFFRCHRSYLVHLPYIRKIDKTSVLLDHAGPLPVSRGKRADLYRAFLDYHRAEE